MSGKIGEGWRNCRRFMGLLWDRKKSVVVTMFLFALLGSVVTVLGVYMPKFMLQTLLCHDSRRFLIGLAVFCGVTAGITFGNHFFGITQEDALARIGFLLKEKIQHISMTMPFEYTENQEILERIQAAMGSVVSAAGAVYKNLPVLISNGILLIFFSVFLWRVSPLVAGLVIVCIPVHIWSAGKGKAFRYGLQTRQTGIQRHKDYIYRIASDYVYAKEIRINYAEDLLKGFFTYYKDSYLGLCGEIQKKDAKVAVIQLTAVLVLELSAYILLAGKAAGGGLTADDFLLYFGMTGALKSVVQQITVSAGELAYGLMNFDRYFTLIDSMEKREPEASLREEQRSRTAEPGLVFRKVSFHYANTGNIIDGFSFSFEPGKHYAIVGENGSGKTTLIKLIAGLYSSYEGEIFVDGEELRTGKGGQVAAVFQDAKIFAGTIRENIIAGNAWDPARYDRLVQDLEISEILKGLAGGDETVLTKTLYDEGIELSGGQCQKIILARALYQGGDILLLDEPTAALDALAEYELYTRFHQIARGKTTLFVSHRLNSTRFCDRILFLEKGRIVEEGSHEELLARGGRYSEMYRLQAQYYVSQGGE